MKISSGNSYWRSVDGYGNLPGTSYWPMKTNKKASTNHTWVSFTWSDNGEVLFTEHRDVFIEQPLA